MGPKKTLFLASSVNSNFSLNFKGLPLMSSSFFTGCSARPLPVFFKIFLMIPLFRREVPDLLKNPVAYPLQSGLQSSIQIYASEPWFFEAGREIRRILGEMSPSHLPEESPGHGGLGSFVAAVPCPKWNRFMKNLDWARSVHGLTSLK